ncbi:DUF5018 domain-containing protein [Ichthyobacterium seriolicida]|uniref:Uncharacterized protein n=1 Tax=Ichthyobacterium seriolicida TaxID=242600 RepID=A0A1J1EA37_9FLAO|nr:DUF5018 domain-containing protein [Ichthyobacterium seriolicida]BAV94384.1 hypothetical protein JBKA6_0371 [Ichthyobacterium seriolicida]
MKTFSFVKSITFSFVLLSVFIFSCEKNKGYDNNLDIGVGIESISLIESENPEKGLVSDITCDIDTAEYTVSLTVPHSAILTGLKFDIKLSEGYSISPASGDEVNFELEESSEESSETPSLQRYKKVFTLTAKDGTAKEYKVYITKGSSNECAISSFKFINDEKNNGKGLVKDITGIIIKSESGEATISLIVPNIADLADLKPTIEISSGATVSPANEEAKTFTSGSEEEYTVTAQDGTTKTYKVTVTKEEGPKLESFKIPADNNKGIRDEVTATFEHEQGSATGKILLNIPYTGTTITLTGLTPTITFPEGCTVNSASGAPVTGEISSVTFTLTKTDTGSQRVYTVEAVKGPSIGKFEFKTGSNSGNGITTDISATSINHDTGAIAITIPSTVNLNQNLTPTIEVESGVTVDPLSETPLTFTANTPVQYKVSTNGIEKTYEVTVTKEAAPRLTKFEIAANNGKGIKEKVEATLTHAEDSDTGTILLKFPKDMDTEISLTELTPTIGVPTGCSVDAPSSQAVSGEISGKTFTLTTTLGSTRTYTVEAVKGPFISSFKFETTSGGSANTGISTTVNGVINHVNNTITITVPSTVDLANTQLTPTITLINGSIDPAPSARLFNNNQTIQYTVKNSTYTSFAKTYTVTVTKEAAPQLTEFKIAAKTSQGIASEVQATLTHAEGSDTGTILLKFPKDMDTDISLTGLMPTITLPDGCSVDPPSGQAVSGEIGMANNNTVTLTSALGSKRVYTITIVKGPFIKSFKFGTASSGTNTGISTTVNGVISHANNTIAITVPSGVTLSSLTPTITLGDDSTSTVEPAASVRPFSSNQAVVYTVKNSTYTDFSKVYTVTVTKEVAPKLTGFTITANPTNGIQNDVTAELTYDDADNAATGTIKLKFEHKVAGYSNEIVLTGLTPTITYPNGYSIDHTSGTEVSESIHEKTFTLTTTLGSKRIYTVQAVKGPFIKLFKFGTANSGTNTGINTEVTGQINHENNTIAITVPGSVKKISSGENKVTLTPTIELGGDDTTAVQPASAQSQQFTIDTALNYTVTGKDGMKKIYDVTVTRTKSNLTQITSFTIDSNSGNITETVSGAADNKGRIVVPVSSPLTGAKTPTILKSDYATITSPSGAETFSYENPVTYTVTAEDNSTTKSYDVYVYDSTKVIVTDSLKLTSNGADITPDSKNIDANARVISITVPTGTDLSNLTLSLDSSSSYTLDPTGEQNFSNETEVKYTLKESGSSNAVGHYWVKIAVAE